MAFVFLFTACGDTTSAKAVDADRLVKLGEQLFHSEGCVNCHGEMGEGVTAPALEDGSVIVTFPACADQLRWVSLGSARWKRDVGPSYGAQSKLVTGGMPGFGSRLDAEQLESVVAFTRVEFGGLEAADAVADCFG
jgi:mono/diheme cytochrome c family protein